MERTLFERLGGTDGISTIVDTAVNNHMENPAVNARFLPLKEHPEKLRIVKEHSVEFFSAGSGGNVPYTGMDMETTHKGMNISPGEYYHVLDDIMRALDQNSIDEVTQKDVLAILWSLKGMIVSK